MHMTFETPDRVKVVVDNAVGLVSVRAVDASVTGVTLEGDTPDAEALIDRATVKCERSGGIDVVTVRIPHRNGGRFMRRNGVIATIEMPTGGDVLAETASADLELSGVFGALMLKTASGRIDADGSAGDVTARTASGDVVIGRAEGRVHLKSASGDLRATQVDGSLSAVTASGGIEAGAVAGELDLRCTSGDVHCGSLAGDATIVAVSGSVRISSYAAGRLRVRNVSGDVTIGIAPGANVAIDAESMSGTARSDIPLSDMPSSRQGNNDVFIIARSVSGDVMVERAHEFSASE
jgi:DUF4097 and DUF4098 domain-containing protein YvlB